MKIKIFFYLFFLFSLNSLFAQECYDEIEKFYIRQHTVTEMPAYPGGFSELCLFLKANMIYSKKAKKNKKEGLVLVDFIINRIDGHVRNAKITSGDDESFNNEVLRLISLMPNWKVGKQSNHEANVQIRIPIRFKLNKDYYK